MLVVMLAALALVILDGARLVAARFGPAAGRQLRTDCFTLTVPPGYERRSGAGCVVTLAAVGPQGTTDVNLAAVDVNLFPDGVPLDEFERYVNNVSGPSAKVAPGSLHRTTVGGRAAVELTTVPTTIGSSVPLTEVVVPYPGGGIRLPDGGVARALMVTGPADLAATRQVIDSLRFG